MDLDPIQLFDTESCTCTYLLAAPDAAAADLIDPVRRHLERDLQSLARLDLPQPKLIGAAVPANRELGLRQRS